MRKAYVARIVKYRSISHGPGHYALGVAKQVARQTSASPQDKALAVDARALASFMPLGASARVLRWPKL